MLNITKNRIDQFIKLEQFKSGQIFKEQKHYKVIRKIIWAFVIICVLFLFLPWTQNIKGAGNVTTLKPNQRPQTIQTIIGGRIEKWYVNEGDYVEKGDTILFISEVKEEYLDPNLIENTGNQVKAKENAVTSYADKVKALENQMGAIQNEKNLKLKQAQNKLKQSYLKVQSDSIDILSRS